MKAQFHNLTSIHLIHRRMYNMPIKSVKLKNPADIKRQVLSEHKCTVPGCNNDITIYKGLGESIYCRNHQLNLKENDNGLAKQDRPYTFHKKWCCSWCGYDPREDQRFDRMVDPKIKKQAQRATLICDHIVKQELAQKLGWTYDQIHGPDNIQTLCQICEKIKSAESGDWHRVTDEEIKAKNT